MEEANYISYFVTQGPFAALFVWLLIHTQNRSKAREERAEQRNKEREDQLYETLGEFAKRYDIVIEKLEDIQSRLPRR